MIAVGYYQWKVSYGLHGINEDFTCLVLHEKTPIGKGWVNWINTGSVLAGLPSLTGLSDPIQYTRLTFFINRTGFSPVYGYQK